MPTEPTETERNHLNNELTYWGLANYKIPTTEVEKDLLIEFNKMPDVD